VGRHQKVSSLSSPGWLNESLAESFKLIFKEYEWKQYVIQRNKRERWSEFPKIIGKIELDEWSLSYTKRIRLTTQWVKSHHWFKTMEWIW
jgi:hypothetical protein